MILIDSHCHLDLLIYKKIYRNIFELINFCNNNYIKYIVSVSITIDNFFDILKLINKFDNVFVTYGVHPLYFNCLNEKKLFKYKNFIFNKKVIGLGETGLDYIKKDIYYRNIQKKNFINHLCLSEKYNKPIVIHSRYSCEDTICILQDFNINKFGGIIHCYSYNSKSNLFKFLNLGLYISISCLITLNSFFFLKDIINYLPLDRLLIESDSPYLSPKFSKSKINNPSNIIYILKIISNIKNVSLTKISKHILNNFKRLFKINLN